MPAMSYVYIVIILLEDVDNEYSEYKHNDTTR